MNTADNLAALPTRDTRITDKEGGIIERLFPYDANLDRPSGGAKRAIKMSIISLFVAMFAFANPWADKFLVMIPYIGSESPYRLLAVKVVLFLVLMTIIEMKL